MSEITNFLHKTAKRHKKHFMNEKMISTKKISIKKTVRIVLPKGFAKFCGQCRNVEIFITTEQAVIYFNLSAREIFRLAETNIIHFHETAEGLIFICANSLAVLRMENANIQKSI